MDKSRSESTRLTLASAVLKGSSFRARVLARARQHFEAVAPEIGLDMELVTRFCRDMESRESTFQALQLVLILAAVLLLGEPGALWCAVLSFLLYFGKRYRERYYYLPKLWRESFDADEFAHGLRTQLGRLEREGISRPGQNIVVYSGFNPFVGSGVAVGGWSFAVDVTRSAADRGSESPDAFELSEFLDGIETAIKKLDLRNASVQDTIFVNGASIPVDGAIQPNRLSRPLQHAETATVRQFTGGGTYSIRTYKWIRIQHWDSDLVLSFFLRASMNGKTLFVELSSFTG